MAYQRIRSPKEFDELIDKLYSTSDGVFSTKADVLAFAASVGASRKQFTPFKEDFGDPIRIDIFENRGYSPLILLLAVFKDGDEALLGTAEEHHNRRVEVFQGYANAGLEIISREIRGVPDVLNAIVGMVIKADQGEADTEGFDLGSLRMDSD